MGRLRGSVKPSVTQPNGCSSVVAPVTTSHSPQQQLGACVADDDSFAKCLTRLPGPAEKTLNDLHPRIQEFVSSHQFADYVCLGQGPFYGLACEAALKITEMSASYAQSFHTLEFRHGPKSIVG